MWEWAPTCAHSQSQLHAYNISCSLTYPFYPCDVSDFCSLWNLHLISDQYKDHYIHTYDTPSLTGAAIFRRLFFFFKEERLHTPKMQLPTWFKFRWCALFGVICWVLCSMACVVWWLAGRWLSNFLTCITINWRQHQGVGVEWAFVWDCWGGALSATLRTHYCCLVVVLVSVSWVRRWMRSVVGLNQKAPALSSWGSIIVSQGPRYGAKLNLIMLIMSWCCVIVRRSLCHWVVAGCCGTAVDPQCMMPHTWGMQGIVSYHS